MSTQQLHETHHVDLENILASFTFKPSLKRYWLAIASIWCICTIYGIIVLPFLLCCYAPGISGLFQSLEVHLTARSLIYKKGGNCGSCCCFGRVEKTILLDRIQDVSFSQGCVQRCYGIQQMAIETAGQSGQGGPECVLIGLSQPQEFRNAILAARHRYVDGGNNKSDGFGISIKDPTSQDFSSQQGLTQAPPDVIMLLTDIRDSLRQIQDSKQQM